MTALTWTVGNWVAQVHQSGGSQSVMFDQRATIGNRVYSIKQQGHSWVLIGAVNDVDDRYRIFDSVDAAKRQAEKWDQAVPADTPLRDAVAAPLASLAVGVP
jgi:hypothetical protein